MICSVITALLTAAVIFARLYIFRRFATYVKIAPRSMNTLKILKEKEKLPKKKRNSEFNSIPERDLLPGLFSISSKITAKPHNITSKPINISSKPFVTDIYVGNTSCWHHNYVTYDIFNSLLCHIRHNKLFKICHI